MNAIKKCPTCSGEYDATNTLCPVDGTVLERTNDELIGKTLAGKYRVEEAVSSGGMGTVYRATHVLMDKTVAIKVLHPALASDESIVARFTREARAASRISHPHALNVTDFGESQEVVFLVMEYLHGRTLKEVVRGDGGLSLIRAAEILRQVAGALDAAHAEGVVHRDLKSDNIMLEEHGAITDWAKVLDFGIAKIQEPTSVDPALTQPNIIIGTPHYMSPEQCSQSSTIDKRSDIYSLGIILYEMLAGHVPFTGASPTEIIMKQMQAEPPSILTERPGLPAEIDELIKRALAKQPEDRFASASGFADAVTRVATGDDAADASLPIAAATGAVGAETNGTGTPTAANDGEQTLPDADEATIVRDRSHVAPHPGYGVPPGAYTASGRSAGINPWRVMIPAALLMVAVLTAVYAFSDRSGDATQTDGLPELQVDPNSQPVEPTTPVATGESERNLPPPSAATDAPVAPVGDALPSAATEPLTTSETGVGSVLVPFEPTIESTANPEASTNAGEAEDVTTSAPAGTPSPSPTTPRDREGRRPSTNPAPPRGGTVPTPTPSTSATPPPPPPRTQQQRRQQREGTTAPRTTAPSTAPRTSPPPPPAQSSPAETP